MNTRFTNSFVLVALIGFSQAGLAAGPCTLTKMGFDNQSKIFAGLKGAEISCDATVKISYEPSSRKAKLIFSKPVTIPAGTASSAICWPQPGTGSVEWTISSDGHSASCEYSTEW